MSYRPYRYPLLLGVLCLPFVWGCRTSRPDTEGKKYTSELITDGWEFSLNGGDFHPVSLPHDWSIALPFDSVNGEGATGYLLGGEGHYRKSLATPKAEVVYLEFDGVYNNATFVLNGDTLGFHPYGYAPIYYELTDYLHPGAAPNELEVLVDRSRYADSRWYTGSGIYRDVILHRFPALHVPVWGTYVTTPEVSEERALIELRIALKNAGNSDFKVADLITVISGPDDETVASAVTEVSVAPGDSTTYRQEFTVQNPTRWDVDNPEQYLATTYLVAEGDTLQTVPTRFGIRSFRFDAAEGFFLNGRNLPIRGVCLHHDGGAVGAAVPKAVWRRRLQTLKDGGCNAIRSAHNPASQEFLDLCDEMGFLVQDEFFDEWDNPKDKRLNMREKSVDYITRGYTEHFQDRAERDLKNTVRAHRNHPSIFQWSIGNEIEWTYPRQQVATGFFGAHWSGNYFWSEPPYSTERIRHLQDSLPRDAYHIGTTAQRLARWTREMDPTRPVTANCILPSASYESGYADALDVIGFSYRRVMYDYARKHYPDLPVMGTENLAQYHEWEAVEERPWVSGTFLWTGIDYLGESNGSWPKKQTTSGLLDLAGFPRGSYYMYKSLWTEAPMIYATTQTLEKSLYRLAADGSVAEKKAGAWERALWSWQEVNEHWNYGAGDTVVVEALSNCPSAELFVDGKSYGQRQLTDFPDHIYKWALPYAGDEVLLRGFPESGAPVEYRIRRAGAPARIEIRELAPPEAGVHQLGIQLYDDRGRPVRHAELDLRFTVEGPATLLGVDNGAADNVAPFSGDRVTTHRGRALTILRLEGRSGTLKVKSSGLPPATYELR